MKWTELVAAISLMASAIVCGLAQTAPPPALAFEAASIKQNKSGEKGASLPPPVGNRLTLTNVPLSALIQYAYHLQDFEVSGTHGWMESERYDVVAMAGGRVTEDEAQRMLQSSLTERFKLKVHREPKDLPIYSLTIAKTGLKMRQSTRECALPSADTISQTPCGGFRLYRRSQLSGKNVPIVELRDMLSTLTGRPVVDETGLNETFDIELKWTPDEVLAVGGEGGVPSDPPGSSLFTALQEQLGLRLEAQRAVVEILVVDSAERPSEN